jgi:serine acetyltransferase
LSIANNIEIGACACVTKTFSIENIKIAGVPAKPL